MTAFASQVQREKYEKETDEVNDIFSPPYGNNDRIWPGYRIQSTKTFNYSCITYRIAYLFRCKFTAN